MDRGAWLQAMGSQKSPTQLTSLNNSNNKDTRLLSSVSRAFRAKSKSLTAAQEACKMRLSVFHYPHEIPCSNQAQDSGSKISVLFPPLSCYFPGEMLFSFITSSCPSLKLHSITPFSAKSYLFPQAGLDAAPGTLEWFTINCLSPLWNNPCLKNLVRLNQCLRTNAVKTLLSGVKTVLSGAKTAGPHHSLHTTGQVSNHGYFFSQNLLLPAPRFLALNTTWVKPQL